MPNYSNPINYTAKLTPQLINLATEGSLDTSIFNGVSAQRTLNMIQTTDTQGHIKITCGVKDGNTLNNAVQSPYNDGWVTIIDTIWIYPVADLNPVLDSFRAASPAIIEEGNNIIFTNASHLYSFFEAVYNATTVSQPVGNVGFSLGVGTQLEDLGVTINLVLASGLKMITWRLVRQLTSQTDLPVGGDSPDGTIGFITIYCDWDQNGVQDPTNLNPATIGFPFGDPLRVSAKSVSI
jgi:hypothetical protein